jgi:hypothetical protein
MTPIIYDMQLNTHMLAPVPWIVVHDCLLFAPQSRRGYRPNGKPRIKTISLNPQLSDFHTHDGIYISASDLRDINRAKKAMPGFIAQEVS